MSARGPINKTSVMSLDILFGVLHDQAVERPLFMKVKLLHSFVLFPVLNTWVAHQFAQGHLFLVIFVEHEERPHLVTVSSHLIGMTCHIISKVGRLLAWRIDVEFTQWHIRLLISFKLLQLLGLWHLTDSTTEVSVHHCWQLDLRVLVIRLKNTESLIQTVCVLVSAHNRLLMTG